MPVPDIFKKTFHLPNNIPAFTGLVIALCCAFFALHHVLPDASPAWLGDWGYISGWGIYMYREVWGFLASSVTHQEPLHLFFNLYWVWILGRELEEELGTLLTLFFWVAAAFVSSAFQLGLTEETGIGASGVVYAIFGYEWASRRFVPRFEDILTSDRVRLFVIWLFACLVLDWFGWMSIANAAHFAGFGFGYLLGYLVEVRAKPNLAWQTAFGLVALSIASAFYAPWTSSWSAAEGFRIAEKDPAAAISWFERVSPKSWVYGYAIAASSESRMKLDDSAGAVANLEKALVSGGDIDHRETYLNSLAWIYATGKDPKVRNGDKAVRYATEACELTQWKDVLCLDTLAAAYAESGKFNEAVKWQSKAVEQLKKDFPEGDLKEYEDRLELYRKKKAFVK